MARRSKKKTGTSGKQRDLTQLLAKAQALKTTDLLSAVLTYGKVLDTAPNNSRALSALRNITSDQRRQLIDAGILLVKNNAAPQALLLSGILSRANPSDHRLAAFETRTLIILKEYQAALDRILPFVALHSDDPNVQMTYGIALAGIQQNQQALDILTPLHDLDQLDGEGINAMGVSLAIVGRLDEADALLLNAARDGRLTTTGLYNLSRQTDISTEQSILDQLVEVFANTDANLSDREMAAYALAKAHEDQDDIDSAFEFIQAANTLKPASEIAQFMTMIRQACGASIRAVSTLNTPSLGSLAPRPRPVFIVGMPRSGTTLVEQILLRHSGVDTIGESNRLAEVFDMLQRQGPAAITAEVFADAYFEALSPDQRNAEVILDKMPPNSFLAGVALQAMPDAKVIHCRRHPMASGFSAFRIRFTKGHNYAHRFDTIADYYRLTENMMTRWTDQFPDRIHPVLYEALTEDPQGWIKGLTEFCGLELEAGLTEYQGSAAPVHTASLAQVRQKIYRGSSEKWKRYSAHLVPLMANLVEEIAHYEVTLEAQLKDQTPAQFGPEPLSGVA